ncbi:lipopolysaccharide biosynthesis protein [Agrococcus baldri]|uniref:lipopolysaccharide biosynthesis protein n=1 Tax=Agrococcus baldri TaxID=153730 RepID=UPI0015A5BBFD|nr:oligosaccharide flippase family protein [Agrococcus baldri]
MLLLATPILTRLYDATDFATLAVVTAIATVLGGLATLSLERALSLPEKVETALALTRVAMLSTAAVGLISTGLAWLFRREVASLLNAPELTDLWWVAPATGSVLAFQSVVSAWMIRWQNYGALGFRNAIQGFVQAAWSILFGLGGFGSIGLATSLGAGRLTAALVTWRPTSAVRRESMATALRAYRRFPLVNSWARLANQLGLQAPTLLIVGLYGPLAAGLYALTIRTIASPVGVIVDAAAQYFEGRFAQMLRDRERGLAAFVASTSARFAGLGVAPAAVLLLTAPTLFGLIFGPEWRDAGVIAQIVVISALAQLVVTPVTRALVMLGRQRTQLAWDVARGACTVAAVVLPALVQAEFLVAIGVLTAVHCLFYGVAFGLCWHAARQADSALEASAP